MRERFWRKSIPYLFLLPQLILVGAFALYPFIYNIILSFQKFSLTGSKFVGLQNYRELFQDRIFWTTLKNTLHYTLGTVPLTTLLALLAAIGLNQKIRGRAIYRTAYLFPNLISWVVIGLIWQWMYSVDYGFFNQILRRLGFSEVKWLLNPKLTIPSIVVASVWHDLGYYMVILLAGLQSISESYYEAASIDGANTWQKFKSITLPLLRPMLFIVFVLSMINSFKVFDQIYVMTNGGPGRASLMIVNYIISVALEEMKLGYASTISVILFIVIFVLTIIQKMIFKDKELEG
jgi:ABC-type sugar transport system permease subunit